MNSAYLKKSAVRSLLTIFLLTLVIFTTLKITSIAQAQLSKRSEFVSLTAIPPRLGENRGLRAKPGEKIQTTVRIVNTSNRAVPVNTSVKDFLIAENGETPIALEGETVISNRWSLASWTSLSPTDQILAPKQSSVINVLIEVPLNALPGGHYAMVVHKPNNEQVVGEGSQSEITQQVGTLLYFLVEGPINEEAFIREFNFPKFNEYGPVPYSFIVENLSDIHIRPQARIEITNIWGKKVDSIQLEPKNVFPLTSRTYQGTWDRIWGFSYYTARIVMSYGTQGNIVVASTKFWLLPIKIVVAAIVILLSITVVIISLRRHIIHRNQDDKKKIEMLEQKVHQMEEEKLKKFDT